MKKLLAIVVLGLLTNQCSELPDVKNQKFLSCRGTTGGGYYLSLQDLRLKDSDIYMATIRNYGDDYTFTKQVKPQGMLMYSSDKYLVFATGWIYRKDVFAIDRISLKASVLQNFYEKNSDLRNDLYVENLLKKSTFNNFICDTTNKPKKQI